MREPKKPPPLAALLTAAEDDPAAEVVRVPGDGLPPPCWPPIGSPRWLRPKPEDEAVEEDTISIVSDSPVSSHHEWVVLHLIG